MNSKSALRSKTAQLPTKYGDFEATVYTDEHQREHMIVKRLLENATRPPLVRLHSECLTGDVFSSLRCDCGDQLDMALKKIAADGHGALVYLRQEGRGIGLGNKMHAYALQDTGLDTVQANLELGFAADERDFSIAVEILKQENISQVRLMTNNPRKIKALEEGGIKVVMREKIIAPQQQQRRNYIATKAKKLGHMFNDDIIED